MDLHLRRGRVIDPANELDEPADVVIRDGRIDRVGRDLATPSGAVVVDCDGMVVAPGLVDIHVHFRDPGFEYKEDIPSGLAAAAAGGFTTVCGMPNTKPVNDQRTVTDRMLARAREAGLARYLPIGAVTKKLEGKELAEIGELHEAGCVAISDDGMPVWDASVLRRALEYARGFDLPLIQHAEDPTLSQGTCMHEGPAATRAGLPGQPHACEDGMIARDLEIVALTGGRYHVAHLSTAGAVRLVRDAKARGLPVTAEVTPHHLHLTDAACCGYDTSTRVNPPLREQSDVDAVRAALADGTIDAIATDHAPHSSIEKDVEFAYASPGLIGLETSVGLILKLVEEGVLDLPTAIARMTLGPARCLSLDVGTLSVGAPADVTVVDPTDAWKVDANAFRSKSRNCPFQGWELPGRAVLTVFEGRVVHDLRKLTT